MMSNSDSGYLGDETAEVAALADKLLAAGKPWECPLGDPKHKDEDKCTCVWYCPSGDHEDDRECDCCSDSQHSSIFDPLCFCEASPWQMAMLDEFAEDQREQRLIDGRQMDLSLLNDDLGADELMPPLPGDDDFIGPLTVKDLIYKFNKNAKKEPVVEVQKWHDHPPQEVIVGNAGWSVSCGKGWDCQSHANEFDVVINLTGTSIKERHIIPIPELAKWSGGGVTATEMLMDWPDMGVVKLKLQFWLDLLSYMTEHKTKLLVFCVGGHGRTGTAVASLLVAGLNYTAKEAIAWVRTNYCERAIETQKQEYYIEDLAAEKLARDQQTTKGDK